MALFSKNEIATLPYLTQFYQLKVPHPFPDELNDFPEKGFDQAYWGSQDQLDFVARSHTHGEWRDLFKDTELDQWLYFLFRQNFEPRLIEQGRERNLFLEADRPQSFITFAGLYHGQMGFPDPEQRIQAQIFAVQGLVRLSELHKPVCKMMDIQADKGKGSLGPWQIYNSIYDRHVGTEHIVPNHDQDGIGYAVGVGPKAQPAVMPSTAFGALLRLLIDFKVAIQHDSFARCTQCNSVFPANKRQVYCSGRCQSLAGSRRYYAAKREQRIMAGEEVRRGRPRKDGLLSN